MYKVKLFVSAMLALSLSQTEILSAKPPAAGSDLNQTITELESLFWNSYNNCNVAAMSRYLADDLEFYHDKDGLTLTSKKVIESINKNLFSDKNRRLRREAIEETIKVYPLSNYGAIISGEHLFYMNTPKNGEFLDGRAKYTHIWKNTSTGWKLSRILSYDHRAPGLDKKRVVVSPAVLSRYEGTYTGSQTKNLTISAIEDRLILNSEGAEFAVFPTSESTFSPEQGRLTFEFVLGSRNSVEKIIVRENGNVAEELKPER